MPELYKEFRAKFTRRREQKKWLESLPLSISEVAKACSRSERTIRDWRAEKFLMDYECLVKLCEITGATPPKVEKLYRYAHTSKAGKKGGQALIAKYGRVPIGEERRKEQWQKWWKQTGKNLDRPILTSVSIRRPSYSANLAEFVGVMLGDGGISDNQVVVTLHSTDDAAYGRFVTALITKLFEVPVSVIKRKNNNANNYVVSRVELVRFCTNKLKLVKGNKVRQQADVPGWIKKNKKFRIDCLRGLVDTDGCVFYHTYTSQGKRYSYKKISFTNRSFPLLRSVHQILASLGIKSRISGSDVRLDSRDAVERYMKTVGTHNPKHLKRYFN